MPTSASPYHYEPEVLATIFRSVKTIAVVGASEQAHKASFSVIMHLQAYGYEVFAVNPAHICHGYCRGHSVSLPRGY